MQFGGFERQSLVTQEASWRVPCGTDRVEGNSALEPTTKIDGDLWPMDVEVS